MHKLCSLASQYGTYAGIMHPMCCYLTKAYCLQESESREMLRRFKAWRDSAEGCQWQAKREQLPVVQIRQGLLEALSQHDVAVVGGDTGCGKTTQVNPPFQKHYTEAFTSQYTASTSTLCWVDYGNLCAALSW